MSLSKLDIRNVISIFSSIHLSIGVFLRGNFFMFHCFLCFTVIALHNFNCIHARLLRDFYQYQYQYQYRHLLTA